MSPRITLATAARVLEQIRHDRRTIALLLVVPSALLFLLSEMLGDAQFDRLGGPMLGMFPFITMFLVTSIAMLRERTTGTLERLMTMPLAKLDLLGGYGLAFALLATVQALVTSAFVFLVLGLDTPGSPALIVFLAVLDAVLGSALGLLASAFASSEFQAVQFMPAFVLPQILLCGLLVPRDQMAGWLDAIASVLPLTFAFEALDAVAVQGEGLSGVSTEIAVLVAFAAVAIGLGALTLRRRTA
ncbi:MAG TPA: ABC transporter permease [Solirubrobacteraceae bacterium]|nr:ABC transporter permease [Solirubrobacteraceae bacterium]